LAYFSSQDSDNPTGENEMARTKKVTFLHIASPMTMEEVRDQHDLAGLFVVNGLEGFSGHVDAATQKAIIGHNVFGKKRVHIDCDGQGKVTVSVKVCFGTDWNSRSYSFEQVLEAARDRRQLEA
jgi:hypothetical protein